MPSVQTQMPVRGPSRWENPEIVLVLGRSCTALIFALTVSISILGWAPKNILFQDGLLRLPMLPPA